MSPSRHRRIDKKHRDKSGEMLWIFFARGRALPSRVTVPWRRAPFDAWLARAFDTKCYRTGAAIQGLFG